MRKIPAKLREQIAEDPFMKTCIYKSPGAPNHNCRGRITWEHSFLYSGRQISEWWAIVPCCENHNSGPAMVKEYNQYRAIIRADINEVIESYPNKNWLVIKNYLIKKYEIL
ncbi:MAG: hypothetical protein H7831_09980 [Magnetococcus sp. WYHC-3]